MSFAELINTLVSAEDALLDSDLNMEELIGDIRDKVDDIKFVRDRLEFEADYLDQQIDRLKKKKATALRNKKSLEDYVNWTMSQAQLEEVPGNDWRIAVKKNPVAVEAKRPADLDDFLKFPNFVKRKIEYSWNLDQVKTSIKSAEIPSELGQELILVQRTHVRFFNKKRLK